MPISPSKSDAFLEALKASAAELPPLPSPSPMFALNAMFSGVLCDLTALRAFGWTLLTPLSAPDDPRKSVFYTWKGMTWLERVWSLPHGAKVVFRLAASPPLVPAPREFHAYVHMPAGLVSRRAHAGEIPCRAFIRFLAAHPVPAAPPPDPDFPAAPPLLPPPVDGRDLPPSLLQAIQAQLQECAPSIPRGLCAHVRRTLNVPAAEPLAASHLAGYLKFVFEAITRASVTSATPSLYQIAAALAPPASPVPDTPDARLALSCPDLLLRLLFFADDISTDLQLRDPSGAALVGPDLLYACDLILRRLLVPDAPLFDSPPDPDDWFPLAALCHHFGLPYPALLAVDAALDVPFDQANFPDAQLDLILRAFLVDYLNTLPARHPVAAPGTRRPAPPDPAFRRELSQILTILFTRESDFIGNSAAPGAADPSEGPGAAPYHAALALLRTLIEPSAARAAAATLRATALRLIRANPAAPGYGRFEPDAPRTRLADYRPYLAPNLPREVLDRMPPPFALPGPTPALPFRTAPAQPAARQPGLWQTRNAILRYARDTALLERALRAFPVPPSWAGHPHPAELDVLPIEGLSSLDLFSGLLSTQPEHAIPRLLTLVHQMLRAIFGDRPSGARLPPSSIPWRIPVLLAPDTTPAAAKLWRIPLLLPPAPPPDETLGLLVQVPSTRPALPSQPTRADFSRMLPVPLLPPASMAATHAAFLALYPYTSLGATEACLRLPNDLPLVAFLPQIPFLPIPLDPSADPLLPLPPAGLAYPMRLAAIPLFLQPLPRRVPDGNTRFNNLVDLPASRAVYELCLNVRPDAPDAPTAPAIRLPLDNALDVSLRVSRLETADFLGFDLPLFHHAPPAPAYAGFFYLYALPSLSRPAMPPADFRALHARSAPYAGNPPPEHNLPPGHLPIRGRTPTYEEALSAAVRLVANDLSLRFGPRSFRILPPNPHFAFIALRRDGHDAYYHLHVSGHPDSPPPTPLPPGVTRVDVHFRPIDPRTSTPALVLLPSPSPFA